MPTLRTSKNAEAITAGEKDPSELGIKAVGDHELEITLEKATPYFDYLLAFPSFFPQSQAVVEEHGDQYAATSDNAVYNGPLFLPDLMDQEPIPNGHTKRMISIGIKIQ